MAGEGDIGTSGEEHLLMERIEMDDRINEKYDWNIMINKEKLLSSMAIGAALMTFLTVSCCAGIPAILSFAGTIGLGFLIKKHLLFPLMVGSLLLGSWGAFISCRSHQDRWIFLGYLSCALVIPLGMKISHPLMYGGLGCLLFLTGSELLKKRRQTNLCK